MTDNAPFFWIPSLSFVDESRREMLAPTDGDEATNIASTNFNWFDDVYIRMTHVRHFLQDANPFLMALLLAGYRTEYIEIAVTDLVSITDRYTPENEIEWLHINFRDNKVKILTRSYNANEQIRIKILPLNGAIPLVEENEDEISGLFFSLFEEDDLGGITPELASFYDEMKQGANHAMTVRYHTHVRAKSIADTGALKFYELRKNIVHEFIEQAHKGSEHISIALPYYCVTSAFGVGNRALKVVSEIVLDSIYWYVLDRIDKAWSRSHTLGEYTYVPDKRLPGLLWIFNPYFWSLTGNQDMSLDMFLDAGEVEESAPEYDVETAYKIYKILDKKSSDYEIIVNGSPPRKLQRTMSIEEKVSFERSNLFTSQPSTFFLEQQCHSHYREEGYRRCNELRDVLAALRLFLGNAESEDDRGHSSHAFAPRLETQRFYEEFEKRLINTDIGLTKSQREISRITRRVAKTTYLETILHMVNLGVLQLQGLDTSADHQSAEDRLPYVEACYEAVEQENGQQDNQKPDTVLLTYVDPTLDDHEYDPVKIKLLNKYEPYELEDSFSWEFIPASIVDIHPDLEAHAQTLGLGDRVRMAPKLIIVAAPGIEIQKADKRPGAPIVEIYRVQSHSLVPDWGERIQIQSLMAPVVVTPFDHFESNNSHYIPPPEGEAAPTVNNQRESDFRYWTQETLDYWRGPNGVFADNTDKIPVVSVQRFRKNGKNGVKIHYTGRAGHFRGVEGEAQVTISVPETSGNDRFAFDFFPIRDEVTRITGQTARTETQPGVGRPNTVTVYDPVYTYDFEVLKYRLIIYRTEGVEVDVKDSGIGVWEFAESMVIGPDITMMFGDLTEDDIFMYYEYEGGFEHIPPQGTALIYNYIGDIPGPGSGIINHSWDEGIDEGNNPIKTYNGTVQWNSSGLTKLILAEGFDKFTIVADIGIGFIPVIGDAADIAELTVAMAFGVDKWGRPVTNFDRLLMLGGVLLPFVSRAALRAMRGTVSEAAEVPAAWLHVKPDKDAYLSSNVVMSE